MFIHWCNFDIKWLCSNMVGDSIGEIFPVGVDDVLNQALGWDRKHHGCVHGVGTCVGVNCVFSLSTQLVSSLLWLKLAKFDTTW